MGYGGWRCSVAFSRTAADVSLPQGGAGPSVLLFLAGNKSDLDDNSRTVSSFEGQRKAEALKTGFMEISAFTGQNVRTFFARIATHLQALHHDDATKPAVPGAWKMHGVRFHHVESPLPHRTGS